MERDDPYRCTGQRLLQIEGAHVSSVTKQGRPAHLRDMNIRPNATTRRIPTTRCVRCDARLPTAAATGRPRIYCGPACRKAAYEDRRARKPEAFQVRIVERTVVESVETTRTVDEDHDIVECVRRVSSSPRAVTNVLAGASGLAKAGTMQLDGKWLPAARALAELNRAMLQGVNHDPRRRSR